MVLISFIQINDFKVFWYWLLTDFECLARQIFNIEAPAVYDGRVLDDLLDMA